jgi:hypothetical protein
MIEATPNQYTLQGGFLRILLYVLFSAYSSLLTIQPIPIRSRLCRTQLVFIATAVTKVIENIPISIILDIVYSLKMLLHTVNHYLLSFY